MPKNLNEVLHNGRAEKEGMAKKGKKTVTKNYRGAESFNRNKLNEEKENGKEKKREKLQNILRNLKKVEEVEKKSDREKKE
jgi:hypothetical protein